MSLPLLIGSAVVGGAINYLSAMDEREEQIKQLNKAADAILATRISPEERRTMIDRIDDTYNTTLFEGLNQSSVGLAVSGILNPGPLRSAYAGKVLGAKASEVAKTQERIDLYNKELEKEASLIRAGGPSGGGSAVDFLVGATGGLQIGAGIENLINTLEQNNQLSDLLKSLFEDETDPIKPNYNIEDDDLKFLME